MLYAKKDIYAVDGEGRRFQVALAGQPIPTTSVRYVDKADVSEGPVATTGGGRAAAASGNAGVIPDATEAAVEFARDNGIDLTAVEGTGKNGRITEGDVKKLIDAEG